MTEEGRKKKNAYIHKYNKAHYKSWAFMTNKRTEADIIEKLKSVDSVSTYIKSLIKKDLQSNQ